MIVGKEDIPVARHQSYYGIRLNFKVIVIGQRKFDIHRHICHSVVLKKKYMGSVKVTVIPFCFVVTLYCEKLFLAGALCISRHRQFKSTINTHSRHFKSSYV